jgi:uncharacterized protein (TIGR01777 family)
LLKEDGVKILICGGTGLIGRTVCRVFVDAGHKVTILTRKFVSGENINPAYVTWDGVTLGEWTSAVDRADGVINLAGENIGTGRWTVERINRIRQSRIDAGAILARAIAFSGHKPEFFIQASAIGAYGVDDEVTFTETSPRGSDSLAEICQHWENSTVAVEEAGIRRIITRIGIVLDKKEGALARMALPFRYFVGGPIGSGRQWLSWIHLEDVAGSMLYLAAHKECSGIYNLAAPHPYRNADFGRILAKAMGRPFWMPVPAFLLKAALGEMSTLVLNGQQVAPERLVNAGYRYKYPELEDALRAIYS